MKAYKAQPNTIKLSIKGELYNGSVPNISVKPASINAISLSDSNKNVLQSIES